MPTALPAASAFTGASVTEGAYKTAMTNLRAYLDELLGAAGGVIAAPDGLVGAPAISFASDPDSGIYRIGSNNWALVAAAAKVIELSAGGEVILPLQPSFLAQLSATASNVTGGGTVWTLAANTEIYDVNGGYNNATFQFTAPVSGKYAFGGGALCNGMTSSENQSVIKLVTSNRTYEFDYLHPYNCRTGGNVFGTSFAQPNVDMDAGDVAYTTLTISGGSDVIDISSGIATFFCGRLQG